MREKEKCPTCGTEFETGAGGCTFTFRIPVGPWVGVGQIATCSFDEHEHYPAFLIRASTPVHDFRPKRFPK